MAEGRAKFEWGIASSMMALLANLNRDPKKESRSSHRTSTRSLPHRRR